MKSSSNPMISIQKMAVSAINADLPSQVVVSVFMAAVARSKMGSVPFRDLLDIAEQIKPAYDRSTQLRIDETVLRMKYIAVVK